MLYTNNNLTAKSKTLKNGTVIIGVTLGEQGRGRVEVFLPLPKGYEEGQIIEAGMHPELNIGFSRSGKPRINAEKSCEIWLMLYSYGNYSRRGNGRIYSAPGTTPEVYARGNGADGDAGRIGNWDDILFRAHAGDTYRIQYSGYDYGIEDDLIFVCANEVHKIPFNDDIEDELEALEIEQKFTLSWDEELGFLLQNSEWLAF